MKLILFQSQLRSKCFSHFKTCEIFSHTTETEFPIDFAIETLSALKINFDTRFSDFDAIENQIKIFQNPFDADIETLAPELQMEMIDLQCSDIIKNKYENSSLLEFYKSLPLTQFDNLHKFARGLFSVFGSSKLRLRLAIDLGLRWWGRVRPNPNPGLIILGQPIAISKTITILGVEFEVSSLTYPNSFAGMDQKSDSGVGTAIIFLSQEHQPVILRLHPDCTAFQAELLAILWAAQIAETSPTKTAVTIASDCRSALAAICSSGPTRTSLVANIIKVLNRAPYIRLCWVPRQTGINGNEQADSAAKITATSVLSHSYSTLP
ncbi:EPM2AIP1 [Cordylochernes scorpioides]|uniref:EPM2AIP1 n=1 Tax=Cordylochernes scorpioides TaxID=51811 RepID=A0ABY6JVB3_9ARAC|nr:EPM2AIP1 [Cordylochernes scorpioides]